VLKFRTIRSYMYPSTSAKDGRALFDALVRLTEGRSWLARNGLIVDRRPDQLQTFDRASV